MYKLLLVTDREEVIQAFQQVPDLQALMFAPLTVIGDPQSAINYLESNAVDAVGYSMRHQDVTPLHHYLVDVRPSLPVFQTHHHGDTLLGELHRVRRFLDALHADHSDTNYDEAQVLEYLRDELIHQLLAREIATKEELKSRLELVRASLALNRAAFLFDFDMPQGDIYLADRWHYGRQRLENALRNNFFGRHHQDLVYGVAVLAPRHVRVIACQQVHFPQQDDEATAAQVMAHVQKAVSDIKEYLDLDLNMEQYTVLQTLQDITGGSPERYEHIE